jgi:hypothetical protein
MAQILPIAHQGKPLDIGRSPQWHHKGSVDQAQHSSPLHPVESVHDVNVVKHGQQALHRSRRVAGSRLDEFPEDPPGILDGA